MKNKIFLGIISLFAFTQIAAKDEVQSLIARNNSNKNITLTIHYNNSSTNPTTFTISPGKQFNLSESSSKKGLWDQFIFSYESSGGYKQFHTYTPKENAATILEIHQMGPAKFFVTEQS